MNRHARLSTRAGVRKSQRASRGDALKVFLVWLCTLCLAGCSTLQPLTADTDSTLAQQIARGRVQPGDRVQIQTLDHAMHRLTVISIDATRLTGAHEAIAIDQILTLEKWQGDSHRTLAIIGGTLLGIIVILAVGLHHGVGYPAGPG